MTTFTTYLETQNKNLANLSNEEIYYLLLDFVKEAAASKAKNTAKRKVYYISAEFLIGKLLSNNLINLGIYKDVKEELAAAGKSIAEVEDVEPEPSLGNGGLGRLASCFIDSISSLGINGEGVGLNYHCGLFKQVFKNNQQEAEANYWIENDSWSPPTCAGPSTRSATTSSAVATPIPSATPNNCPSCSSSTLSKASMPRTR